MSLFRRYDNGYDLGTDSVYCQWKYLKDLIDSGVSGIQRFGHGHPSLKKCLSELMPQKAKKRSVARTLHLPKHVTGDKFIEEKERKKQEEIEKKEREKRNVTV